eukprot:363784-Chlamydomonas_euryale.AAC.5
MRSTAQRGFRVAAGAAAVAFLPAAFACDVVAAMFGTVKGEECHRMRPAAAAAAAHPSPDPGALRGGRVCRGC